MQSRKKCLPVILLALLLALTACNTGGKPREIHKVDWITSPAYLAEDAALPVQTGDLSGCCTDGEYLYVLADEQAEDGPRSVLSRVRLSDGAAETLDQYEPPQTPEESYANRLGPIVGPDGSLWVYEAWTVLYFDFPEDYDPDKTVRSKYLTGQDDFHHLRQLDPATGKQKKLIDLGEAAADLGIESFSDVLGLAVDGGGNAYIAASNGVSVTDGKGKLLFTLEANIPYAFSYNSAGGALAVLPDGTVAALALKSGVSREVRTIDAAAKDWGEVRYATSGMADLVYSGTGGFLFFYTQDRDLYAWEPEAEEPRKLLSWTSMDLEGTVMCFTPLDEGKLAALTFQSAPLTESFYNSQIRLYLLSPSGKDPNAGKTKLVYGTLFSFYDDDLRDRINRFNKESDRWIIELRDYAGENTDPVSLSYDEYWQIRDAAIQRLRADVAAGNGPDIWDGTLDLDIFARRGYLEDLWPWIDGDEEIGGREALMSHALECVSLDGKLYELSSDFGILTAIARADVVGNRTGWTLEEMLECWRQLPEGSTILPPDEDGYELLYYLFRFDDGRWVDWSDGTCHFDTQAFRDLMELCKEVQENYDPDAPACDPYTGLRDKKYLLKPNGNLTRIDNLLQNDALCSGPEHIVDYGSYLNENHIYSSSTDEEGNRRDKDAVICDMLYLMEKSKEDGMIASYWPLAADAAIGALEGGGYAAYVGMPSQSGSGSAIILHNSAGISVSCRDKEGAWAFLRRRLLPGGDLPQDRYSYLPINKADFDRQFEPKWFQNAQGEYLLDADGRRIEEPRMNNIMVPQMDPDSGIPIAMLLYDLAPNEAQREAFWTLYESIGPSQWLDVALRNIIEEQAGAYFAGDKTLDETVDLIQRRAALYVNENR